MGYIGIMEKKMETLGPFKGVEGLGLWGLGIRDFRGLRV